MKIAAALMKQALMKGNSTWQPMFPLS